jgi:hypothetical protein
MLRTYWLREEFDGDVDVDTEEGTKVRVYDENDNIVKILKDINGNDFPPGIWDWCAPEDEPHEDVVFHVIDICDSELAILNGKIIAYRRRESNVMPDGEWIQL